MPADETATAITISREPFDSADAAALRQAQRDELDARYGRDDHEPGEKPTADSVPVFLVARTPSGRPIGCGGLRPLPGGGAEIKRMFVTAPARGTGVAVTLLRAIEEEARGMGLDRLVLETGTEQPDAMRFYEREGYSRIPLFGAYVGSDLSVCYARDL
ncbi:GNAT family N-acetyltransferase [Herbiconiux sp. CPCC 203407]|uniref:GNAT family N-acetyltransferase n=1 Tax=Herbiconiux oxytropis TaxID=2970915 RepID=A0AA41XF34_9MICO|nr:GNAT family N-acetyltransferase [Herbiconiux oxytropis]MCS5723984.1 GNAT family N-acetyltransferase [Herbiconiux oxytropis]MCS5726827.1 GNAT family N-acetyltransferase [Herbiconiux oxytropis]